MIKFSTSDGYLVLADRLWSRGISKETDDINELNKDFAPSITLNYIKKLNSYR